MKKTKLTEPPTVYAVMLQRGSLQKLIDLPESSRRSVRTIEICTTRLSRQVYDLYDRYFRPPSPAPENVGIGGVSLSSVVDKGDYGYIDFKREADDAQREAGDRYLRLLEQQEEFTKSGLAIEFLTRAMNCLPNCHNIRLSDANKPLGADQLDYDVGYNLRKGFDPGCQESQEYVKYVLRTALAAISMTCTKVANFEVCLLPCLGQPGTSPITGHSLELTTDYQMLCHQSLDGISSLKLVLNPGSNRYWDKHVSTFLNVFPNLSHFQLQLADNSNEVPFTKIAEIARSKPLHTFELVHGSTTEAFLVELLLSFETKLEKIVLCNVNIDTNGGWPSIIAKVGARLPANSLVLQNCRCLGYPLATSTNHIPQSFKIVSERDAEMVAELLQKATLAVVSPT